MYSEELNGDGLAVMTAPVLLQLVIFITLPLHCSLVKTDDRCQPATHVLCFIFPPLALLIITLCHSAKETCVET